ncbi:MAG: hypothetical protein AWM53_00210 [Candidatus Dichloromethanomonas elyunquensis]|nr:MAG: hypothetical protein AWM53_00210 [Candidatus Dichloromethanomonas elyunquensis]
MNIPMFKTGDKILIVSILIIAVFFIGWRSFGVGRDQQLTAVITQNGKLLKQINLNNLQAAESIDINQPLHQVILAEKGRIRFSESDCPNKICVKTGWLTKAGDRAVCIPSKVVISVVGQNQKMDTVSY